MPRASHRVSRGSMPPSCCGCSPNCSSSCRRRGRRRNPNWCFFRRGHLLFSQAPRARKVGRTAALQRRGPGPLPIGARAWAKRCSKVRRAPSAARSAARSCVAYSVPFSANAVDSWQGRFIVWNRKSAGNPFGGPGWASSAGEATKARKGLGDGSDKKRRAAQEGKATRQKMEVWTFFANPLTIRSLFLKHSVRSNESPRGFP
jgi:hypothetical protein